METLFLTRKAPVVIGRRRENNAKKIVFDISHWLEVYGEGTVVLLHQRSGDASPYPCDIEVADGKVSWVVTETDTFKEGRGSVELQYRIDETVAKSETWTTIVEGSLPDVGEAPEDPQPEWISKVIQAWEDAKNAQMHGPIIGENGNWFVWSHEEGAYKDTGILARGETLNETDPTVHDWAKQPEKPKYTAKEVGALPDTTEIPKVPGSLPNPKKLKFSGAVTVEYDGSSEVTVNIPEGGTDGDYIPAPATAEVGQVMRVAAVDENGKPTEWEPYAEGNWELIETIVLEEDVERMTLQTEPDGTPYKFRKMAVQALTPAAEAVSNSNTAFITNRSHTLSFYMTNFNNTKKTRSLCLCELNAREVYGLYNAHTSIYCYNSYDISGSAFRMINELLDYEQGWIKAINLTANMFAGTEFKIYGVRA